MNFRILLIKEFFKNLKNNYTDNYTKDCGSSIVDDEHSPYEVASERSFKDYVQFLRKIYNFINRNRKYFFGRYHIGFSYLYEKLADEESKNLLVKILMYRMLGYRKVKLPLNNTWYWQKMDEIENSFSKEDVIRVKADGAELKKINLEKIGYPIEMYYIAIGVMTEFVIKQYEYKNIKVSKGDTVIDAGACWGDTALLFANEVGDTGKVFSFEFIPSNLKILHKNIGLNQNLKNRIEVIENPVWSQSGKVVNYVEDGPGSVASLKNGNDLKNQATTVTIDEVVKQNNLKKVDFIKMDIEGAEPEAVKGAVETIKRFKPKLAICLYHSLNDFVDIPRFINELNLDYKLYLKHSSIYAGETVLFATTD